MSTYNSKVEINGDTYYIKLDWIENDTDLFKILLVNDKDEDKYEHGWTGTYTTETAKKRLHSLYQTDNEYFSNTRNCLLGKGGDEYLMDLLVECPSKDTATLCWKKRVEGLCQEHGTLVLHRDHTRSKNTIIDFLIDDIRFVRSTITKMEQQIEEMKMELVSCKNELTQLMTLKLTTEDELYAKFVNLLNSKKLRIKLLEEELQNYLN